MAARRTDMHRLQEVVRLHRMGRSRRQIERELRMSRHTITEAFRAFESSALLEGAAGDLPEVRDRRGWRGIAASVQRRVS